VNKTVDHRARFVKTQC